jgi:hypothetical protein
MQCGTPPQNTMIKNSDTNGSVDTNPYKFRHYDISEFSLYVIGRRVRIEGLSLYMDHEKSSVMVYRTLFEESGKHHSNTGLQITHDMFINSYLCFSLISLLIGERRRLIRHSKRMTISGSN